MVQVNAIGDACPIPVIKTLHALQDLNGAGTVQTLVDNEIAVQNLTRLAESKGCSITTEKRSDKEFCVTITTENSIGKRQKPMSRLPARYRRRRKRRSLSFPPTIWARAIRNWAVFSSRALFCAHPAGAPAEHDSVLQRRRTPDLRRLGIARGSENLASLGVEILTCGTCLNHYGLTDKLAVGDVTNMYVITEKQMQADLILRP